MDVDASPATVRPDAGGAAKDQPAIGEAPTVAGVIVEYLASAGIEHLFGYPGTPNIELIEEARRRDFALVLARREGTAGFMAEAYGMLTGRPGVCFSTLGPGSTSLVNAVANAHLDRVPMLAISGQVSASKEQHLTHQVVDHQRLFAPITKWAARVDPDTVASTMRKALRVATAERPGSVHLSTSSDVVSAPASDAEIDLPPIQSSEGWTQSFQRPGVGTDPTRMLANAERPLVLAGIAAARAGATSALTALAETVGCPVVVSAMSKGVFPEEHPYFAGTLDMACSELVWDLLRQSDLVLAVGFDAVELIKPWPVRAPTIHVDATPNTDQIYAAQTELVGSITHILEALTAAYKGAPRWEEAEVTRHREAVSQTYYSGRVAGKLNPTDVVDALMNVFQGDAIVTTDVGSHKILVGQGWHPTRSRSFLTTNGLSSMGFSLPAALCAKLLHPEQDVVCTVGDGGFAMVQSELGLAVELGLGPIVVVFCDGSLNRIELKQNLRGYPSAMTRFDDTDLVKLAESMNCDGERVDSQADLERILGQAAEGLDRPLVVEARIDPSQYVAQF